MPVEIREKRRSLYVTKNNKQLHGDNNRPKSWFSPVEVDPYTSVRKIFYEFPRKDFYGDSVIHETCDLDLIQNSPDENEESVTISLRMDVKKHTPRPSPTPSGRSNDTNNNIFSKSKPLFSSHLFPINNDEINLKVESSNYADFYVPARGNNRSQFSRFSSKRKSFDPSKLKQMKEEEIFLDPCNFKKQSSQDLIQSKETPIVPKNCNETVVSHRAKVGYEGHANDVYYNENNVFTSMQIYIPWTKRRTLLETNYFVREQEPFNNRRNSPKFSSLRNRNGYSSKKTNFPSLKRSTTFESDTLISYESRRSSMKTRRLSTLSLASRQNSDIQTINFARMPSKREKKFVFLNFFSNYQDRLRNLNEISGSRDMLMLSSARKLYPELLKLFVIDSKTTFRHIFYVRSRLSESAKKEEFHCDGWFGCEELCCTWQIIN